MVQRGIAMMVTMAGLILASAPAWAESSIVLPRAGQVGVGVQGQFGMLQGSKDLAAQFENGAGFAVRARYRMRFERAIGLSFESQSFDAKSNLVQAEGFPTQPDSTGFERVVLTTAGADFYQMFGTRTRTVKMLSVGVGIAQISARLRDGQTVFPVTNEGFYMSVGGGIERFFYRSWALDLSTRYLLLVHDGAVNHDAQVSAGIVFYASY